MMRCTSSLPGCQKSMNSTSAAGRVSFNLSCFHMLLDEKVGFFRAELGYLLGYLECQA